MSLKLPQDDPGYDLWLNAERTILVRMWDNGIVEIATRSDPGESWGPPVQLDRDTA